MAASVLHQASFNFTTAASSTRFPVLASCRAVQSSVEADAQRTYKYAGVLTKLWFRILTNAASGGTSTIRSRINAANGNLVQTIGASATGEFSDLVNSDTVAANDEVNSSIVTASGGGLTPSIISYIFTPDSTNVSIHSTPLSSTAPTASTTYYRSISGGASALITTEANVQAKMKSGGTIKNLYLKPATNGRSSSTVYKSRKNGADGNLTVTVTAGSTTLVEDTSNSDTYAVDDLFNFSIAFGTGTGNLFIDSGGVDMEPTASDIQLVAGGNSLLVLIGVTNYYWVTGELVSRTTETDTRGQINYAPTASKLEAYISANTIVEASPLRLRVNGANVNQVASITGLTTGWFEDASNTDVIADGDEINYQLVTGATGTSLTLQTIAMLLSIVAVAGGGPLIGESRLLGGLVHGRLAA